MLSTHLIIPMKLPTTKHLTDQDMVDCRGSVCLMCKVIWGLSCLLKNLSVFISSKKLFFLLKLTLHDTCAWRQYSLIYIGMSTMPKSIYKMCPIEALIIIYWDVKITKPFWATLNTEQRKACHRSARTERYFQMRDTLIHSYNYCS